MSVAGNIEVVNPLVRTVFNNTNENDMTIFVDTPSQSIHIGCTSNGSLPSTVMVTSSNLVLNGDILFPNKQIAMSRLRITQPDTLVVSANISSSYSTIPGINPNNGSNFDFSLPVMASNFRFMTTNTGNMCAFIGSDGSVGVDNLTTSNLIRLNRYGELSNITGISMSNGQILLTDGSSNMPAIAFGSDSNTGIYRAGSGKVGIACDGDLIATLSNSGISISGSLSAKKIITEESLIVNQIATIRGLKLVRLS